MKDKNSQMDVGHSDNLSSQHSSIKELLVENERLRTLISKITQSMTWGNSVIKVVFRDEFFEEKYRSKIENFLKEILAPDENFILNSQIYDNTEQEYRTNQESFQAEKLNKQHNKAGNSQSNIPLDSDTTHSNSNSEIPHVNNYLENVQVSSDSKISHENIDPENININKSSQNEQVDSNLKSVYDDIYPGFMNFNESPPNELDTTEKRKSSGRMSEILKKMRHSTHELGPDCKCKRFRCFEIVPEHERIRIIREFNELSSYDKQNQYLTGLIAVLPVTRHRNRKPISETTLHTCSTSYSVRVLTDANGFYEYLPICYKAFMSLHGITSRRIQTIRESILTTGAAPIDKRGKHSNRPQKLSDETKVKIEDFIETLVKKEFPEGLTENPKSFISKDFNVKKMHRMFLEKYPEDYISCGMFRSIFNAKYDQDYPSPENQEKVKK